MSIDLYDDFHTLSPYDFDQTFKGWRMLDKQGEYIEAAKTIEHYISKYLAEIKSQNLVSIQTMYFHAGQEYATAGKKYYKMAVYNFEKSFKSKIEWDLYVAGTIAFLKKDIDQLQINATELAKCAKINPVLASNSKLLNDFLDSVNTELEYSAIYSAS